MTAFHNICPFCGEPATQSDHIEPRSEGGSDEWWNRSPICATCNMAKGTKDLLTFLSIRAGVDVAPDVREGIVRAREAKEAAQADRDEATDELRLWLGFAQRCRGITMNEAAALCGLTRVRCYELLRGD